MATHGRTTVTPSGYNPNYEFRLGSGRDGITADSYTINLDCQRILCFEA